MKVNGRMINGRKIEIEILSDDNSYYSIEQLKYKIENIVGIPSSQQRLLFQEKLMDDFDSVFDYLTDGSTFDLMISTNKTNSSRETRLG